MRRPDLTFGTFDHNVPTVNIYDIRDVISKAQIDKLAENVEEFGIEHAAHGSEKQGIVHMVGPETGRTQPGKFIVCGDSHTATHGAFGAIAFGIGTSEVEHVFATQTLWQVKPKKMLVEFTGVPQKEFMPRFHPSLDCQVRCCLWCWLCGGVSWSSDLMHLVWKSE